MDNASAWVRLVSRITGAQIGASLAACCMTIDFLLSFRRLLRPLRFVAAGLVLTMGLSRGAAVGPTVTGISSRGNPTGITINWSKPVSSTATNPANYTVNHAIIVTTARYGASNSVIVLTTTSLTEATNYSVTISGVQDTATPPNTISPNPTVVSFIHGLGYEARPIVFKKFNNITGVLVSDLTNNSAFPSNPTWVTYPLLFEDPSPSDSSSTNDNYGAQLIGLYVAQASGQYTFYMASDDQGVAFLSIDDQPANKTQIAFEPQWNNTRDYTGTNRRNPSAPENRSVPLTLAGGQRYYLESLLKEGGGGNNISVAVQEPGQGIPTTPIPSSRFAPTRSVNGQTFFTLGSVFFTKQPTNVTINEGQAATFNASIDGTPPYSLHWLSNGVAIVGAAGFTLITPPLSANASGAAYSLVVSNEFSTVTSANAHLTVIPDTTSPTIALAQNIGTTILNVTFSEALQPASATNLLNYALTGGITISAAVLGADNRTVALTASPLTMGANYTITVNNVRDRAATPNTIAANSQFTFTATDLTPQDIGNPALPGSSLSVSGGKDVTAAGSDIGNTSDQFHLEYQLRSGDFDVKVRVAGLVASDAWAKAGLMARETLDAAGRFAASLATPSVSGCLFEYRDPAGGSANTAGTFPANYPNTWLRLQRIGNQFTSYAGYDGTVWTQLGSAYIAMSNTVFFGFAVTSHNPNQTTVAQFRDFQNVTAATVAAQSRGAEPLGPCTRKTGHVISEIMWSPAPRTDGKNLEYIEIFNSNPFWDDISGCQLAGDITFTFPPNTILPGGAFLVVAAAPADVQSVYGVTNVIGPYLGSLRKPILVQMLGKTSEVLLEVPINSTPLWPLAADGTGHSIVLARPSYGEGDGRAWSISDVAGGSPGAQEAFRPSPLRNVVLNEYLARPNPSLLGYIELYNHSAVPVDVSGCVLTDDSALNKFVIPASTIMGQTSFLSFDKNQLGFLPNPAGGTLYLRNPDGSRVLDAVLVEPQAQDVSFGRYPNGAADWHPMAARTPGAANSNILIRDIVINELMYNPFSGNDDDQYIELYNKGATNVNLGGWQFTAGVKFTFPSNVVMAPGNYLVVARNTTNLLARYGNLNTANTVGNYTGKLSHNGERLALAMPDPFVKTNSHGNLNTNTIYVVEDEVTYGTGGRWGQWASGGGSSLELIDSRANHRLAYNWADSDETSKSAWTNIETTGVLDNGANYEASIQHVQIGLLDVGECLVDNIEVRPGTVGANYIANSTFDTDLSNWTPQGDHIRSSLEPSGYQSSQSLHLRCSDRLWTGANSVQGVLNNTTLASGQTATLRFKARWLRGWPEPLLRLNGNWLETSATLPVPANLGTPGLPNSRALANAGPAIYEVTHTPSLPPPSQPAVVTARCYDPDGVQTLILNYRIDPNASYTSVPMVDNGTGSDFLAGDGIFSATIPGQTANTVVAFYVSANDGAGAGTRFPALPTDNSPTPECVVMFGDTIPTSGFGTYHVFLTQDKINRWSSLPDMSNESFDCTFVYGDRVIYDMLARYSGSPYHQQFNSPVGNLCHYKWIFPEDDKFLGATSFNKIHQPGNGPGDDDTVQREQTGYWMARQLGLPWNYRRYVNVFMNGNRRGSLMEDTQVPDGDVIKERFPNDSDGFLYKMQPWFEFDANGSGFNNNSWCTLNNYTTTGGVKKMARYRFNYLGRRTADSANNYTNIFNMVDAASIDTSVTWTNFAAAMSAVIDFEEWMRTFAMQHAVGNWDSFGNSNGQNTYGYTRLPNVKYTLFIWDLNILLASATTPDGPTGDDLFKYNGSDSNMGKLYSTPPFRRAYLRAFYDIVNGPMNPDNVNPVMDAKYAAFLAAGLGVNAPDAIKNYISARRNYILSTLATVAAPFATGNDFATNNNLVTLTGTAPVGVKTIKINGIAYTPAWTTITNWTILFPIGPGANLLTLQGYDTFGNAIPNASDSIWATNTGPSAVPPGNVVINEIMYHPPIGGSEFVEIYNAHPTVTFDLSDWRLDGVDFTFPQGTILRPGKFLLVIMNVEVFVNTYGPNLPIAGVFLGKLDPAGDTLKLVRPAAGTNLDQLIDQVQYQNTLPWPAAADGSGASLQLIDAAQDNWRAGNWTAVPTNRPGPYATPGAPNSVRASLAAFPLVWINELQAFNTNGVADNFGEPDPWIELYNNGPTNVSLTEFFLTDNYSNLTAWPFPAGAAIGAGQFMILWADGQTNQTAAANYHASFRFTNSAGGLALVRTNAAGTNVLDYVNYLGQTPNRSFGSYPDGQPQTRQIFFFPTPGGTNNPTLVPVPAIVNEWMADNSPPGGFPDPFNDAYDDWFELFNPNTNTVDLSGYYLSGNLTKPKKFLIPSGTLIPSHQFLLVWADDNPALNGTGTNGDLHVPFRLAASGDSIGLFAPDTTPQSTVTFGQQFPNVSQGRWPDGNAGGGIYFMTNFTPRAANVINQSNHPPVLNPINNLAGNELSLIIFNAIASDPDTGQTLTFSLDPGAPPGASINPGSGVFSWTPSEAQGPGSFSVTVRATDNGTPNLSTAQSLTITVNEVNSPPVLTSIGSKTVNELAQITFTASATDADIPANNLRFSLDAGAPSGTSIDPISGLFTWTPSEAQGPGNYAITVRVTDNGVPPLSDPETITVSVNEVNSAPVLSPIGNITNYELLPITFTASATDSDLPANTLSFSLLGAPPGASMNSSSGIFSWTPNEAQGPSTNNITVTVTDTGIPALSDQKTFTIVVLESNRPPVLSPIASLTNFEGTLMSFTASASDADIPANTLTFSLGSNPPTGASLNSANGFFTWTPSESQGGTTYTFSAIVTDNGLPPMSATQSVTIAVLKTNSPPSLNPIPNLTNNEQTLISFTATAADSDLPAQTLSFSLESAAPAGASINTGSGVFTWTPIEAQGPSTNLIRVIVTDNGAPPMSATQLVTIVVNEVNLAPILNPMANQTINELTLISFAATASDPDLPANTLTFTLISPPVGASINAGSGLLTWTPTEAQGPATNTFSVKVLDNGLPPLSATQTMTIVVNEVNVAPVLNPIFNRTNNEQTLITFTATATDSDIPANILTFSLDPGFPAGAAINSSSGLFTWTPGAAQGPSTNPIVVRVTDNGAPSLSATQLVTIVVADVNTAPALNPIASLTNNEQTLITFTTTATDSDIPANTLRFTLDAGAPSGASINPGTGVFTWTPSEAQGPSTNQIIVRVTDNGVPPLSATQLVTIMVNEVNVAPALASIASLTNNELTLITFTAAASDSDLPPNTLTFSLDAGAPAGAAIQPGSGVFTWTPTEAQGPGTNSIVVRVTDNGAPPLSATQTVIIVVSEVNSGPVLNPVANLTVNELTFVSFAASATDSDLPVNTLSFSLDFGAPTGAAINSASGVFTWTPTEIQGPSTNPVRVIVTDNGAPSLSATQLMTIVVKEVNSPPILSLPGNQTVKEGTLLTFTASAADPDIPANTLSFSLDPGAPAGAAINSGTGVFTWSPPLGSAPATNRVTVRVADNGAPPLSATGTILIVISAQFPPTVVLTTPSNTNVYLPGARITLVASASSPGGAIAKVAFLADGTKLGEAATTPYSLVWSNAAIGSHLLQASATDTNGLVNLSAIVSIDVRPGAITNMTLVATGSVSIWKYLDNGSDQGVAWREPNFNDGSWASGPAPLGYGDANGIFPATTNSYGPDPNNKYITTYYRHSFEVADASAFTDFIVSLDRDDGAVVYLNGIEVFRSNMPGGAISNNTFASTVVGSVAETTYYSTNFGPGPLVSGTNVFAVEIHQANVTSSDIFMDLGLGATQMVFAPWIVSQPANQRSPIGSNVTFTVSARGTPALRYQWLFNGTPLAGANGASLALANAQRTDAGNYGVTISNSVGVVTSAIASLVITAPTLGLIGNQTMAEGTLLSFTITGTDADLPNDTLAFSLDPGAPAGAALDAHTGMFNWTPTEAQGPGSYAITVRVTDADTPPQSDTRTFTVTVTEVNSPPVLAAIPNHTLDEKTLLTFTATATDPDIPSNTLSFSLDPGAPAGAVINPDTGVFTWLPNEAQGPSSYVVSVRVTDNGTPPLSNVKTFSVLVNESNSPPVLNPIPNVTINELTLLSFTATASDPDIPENPLTFSIVSGPAGASINSASGLFIWTPTETQGPSTNPVAIRVTDNGTPPLSDQKAFSIVVTEVNSPPTLSPLANLTVNELTPISFAVLATDNDIPANTLAFSLVSASSGASLDSATGLFTWTPTEAQGPSTNIITIKVTDNGAPPASDQQSFTITVREVNSAPVLAAISNFTIDEGSQLTFTNIATDSDIPPNNLTFSLDSGFPTGAAINSTNGVFTWTPDESQGGTSNAITVRVTDDGSPPLSDARTFAVIVKEVNSPPVLGKISDRTVNELSLLTFTAIASDPDIPAQTVTFGLDAGSPAGALINAGTGVFTWTPTESQGPGSYNESVIVTDNGTPALSSTQRLTITVLEVNAPPILGPLADRTVDEGNLISFTATATDPDLPANTLTFSLDPGAPTGATIDAVTGLFSWTPTEAQGPSINSMVVRVTDNGWPPLSEARTFTIVVNEVNQPPVPVPIGSRTIDEGSLLSFTATATDADLPPQKLSFGLDAGSPDGSVINPVTGAFTWTPNESQGGSSYLVTIRVTDDGSPALSRAETISILVNEVNSPPSLSTIASTNVNEGDLLTFPVTGSDPDIPAQVLTFSLDPGAPANALISPTNGVFTWIPDETQGGTTNIITIRVTDDGVPPLSATAIVTIVVQEVNSPPVLLPISNKHVGEGGFLFFIISALDPDIPAQTLTYSADAGAPDGLGIDAVSGQVSWVPTQAQAPGSYFVTFRVTDNGIPPQTAAQTILIDVTSVNKTPLLAGIPMQVVDEKTLLTFTATATDADHPPQHLTFSLAPGAPPGASITPNGVFTWTPAEAQGPSTNAMIVRVTDDGSPPLTAAQTVTIIVNEVSQPPVLAPVADQMINAGQPLVLTISATDPDLPPQILTFSLDAAPAGASLDASSGIFNWTAPIVITTITNQIIFRVTDSGSPPLSDSKTIQVIVVAAPRFNSITVSESGAVKLFWQSQPGKSYRILYTSDLGAGPWSPLGDDILATDIVTFRTDTPAAGQPRFYRILQVD